MSNPVRRLARRVPVSSARAVAASTAPFRGSLGRSLDRSGQACSAPLSAFASTAADRPEAPGIAKQAAPKAPLDLEDAEDPLEAEELEFITSCLLEDIMEGLLREGKAEEATPGFGVSIADGAMIISVPGSKDAISLEPRPRAGVMLLKGPNDEEPRVFRFDPVQRDWLEVNAAEKDKEKNKDKSEGSHRHAHRHKKSRKQEERAFGGSDDHYRLKETDEGGGRQWRASAHGQGQGHEMEGEGEDATPPGQQQPAALLSVLVAHFRELGAAGKAEDEEMRPRGNDLK